MTSFGRGFDMQCNIDTKQVLRLNTLPKIPQKYAVKILMYSPVVLSLQFSFKGWYEHLAKLNLNQLNQHYSFSAALCCSSTKVYIGQP